MEFDQHDDEKYIWTYSYFYSLRRPLKQSPDYDIYVNSVQNQIELMKLDDKPLDGYTFIDDKYFYINLTLTEDQYRHIFDCMIFPIYRDHIWETTKTISYAHKNTIKQTNNDHPRRCNGVSQ